MAAPTATGSLDKPSGYAAGATMTATINYSDPDTKTGTVTFQIADNSTPANTAPPIVLPYKIDPSTIAYTDSLGKVWTKVSDNGSVAVFTAQA